MVTHGASRRLKSRKRQVESWGGDLVDFQVVLVPSQAANANPSVTLGSSYRFRTKNSLNCARMQQMSLALKQTAELSDDNYSAQLVHTAASVNLLSPVGGVSGARCRRINIDDSCSKASPCSSSSLSSSTFTPTLLVSRSFKLVNTCLYRNRSHRLCNQCKKT